jgi:U1 small nuclear ribonucleoprotein
MTDKLPPNLLALFAPRPPLRFLAHGDLAPEARKTTQVSGIGQYLAALQEYKETDVYVPTESWLQKRDRKRLERKQKTLHQMTEGIKECEFDIRELTGDGLTQSADKPVEDAKKRGFGDAYKTLFVARLAYDTEVKDLEREFGRFGPIERVRVIWHIARAALITCNRYDWSPTPTLPKMLPRKRNREVTHSLSLSARTI